MTKRASPDEVLEDFEALLSSPLTTYFSLGAFVAVHRIRFLESLRASGSGKIRQSPRIVRDGETANPTATGEKP